MTVVNLIGSTHKLIMSQGYRLTDDAWDEDGRRTYLHDDNASVSQFNNLKSALARVGWVKDLNSLWVMRHPPTDEILEFEPGGPDVSGHLLHHLKAAE
jgi:hypothetical protein